mmetsp:Transcript_6347/g.24516  ORF Transcript_6347/g.24516 Transcript_6347/m.24516 type:complete len:187 (+) Transcript_6347:1198-1758(+)
MALPEVKRSGYALSGVDVPPVGGSTGPEETCAKLFTWIPPRPAMRLKPKPKPEGAGEGADEGADEGAVDDVDMDAIREPSASAVYNGGQAGGSGRGFGGADRWSSRGGNSGGGSGDGDGRVPAVGCKRRLSAVLELDGLADQLERQARCSTPPVPAGGAGRAAATTANPTTGSPTRKFFRMDGRPA